MKVTNEKAYKSKFAPHVDVSVRLMLDPVPGAWHQPEDFLNWVCQHPYVQEAEVKEEGSVENLLLSFIDPTEKDLSLHDQMKSIANRILNDLVWKKYLQLLGQGVTRLPDGRHVAYSSVQDFYR